MPGLGTENKGWGSWKVPRGHSACIPPAPGTGDICAVATKLGDRIKHLCPHNKEEGQAEGAGQGGSVGSSRGRGYTAPGCNPFSHTLGLGRSVRW